MRRPRPAPRVPSRRSWSTLNLKVFRRLGFSVEKAEIDSLVGCRPGAVELLLMRLQKHISEIRSGRRAVASPQALLEAGAAAETSAGAGGVPVAPAHAAHVHAATHAAHQDFATAAAGIGAAGAPAASAAPPHAPQAGSAAAHHGGGGVGGAGGHHAAATSAVDAALLAEKDAALRDLHETVEILELKIRKLEQLVKLKDSRIQTLTARLGAAGTAGAGGGAQ